MDIEENKLSYIVDEYNAGARADKFLSIACEELSRSRLLKLIKNGDVSVNGAPLKSASLKVEEGMEFTVCVPPPIHGDPMPENIDIDIIYEDDDLLVINKSAGMVVHPGAGNWSGTLVNALLYHCSDSLSGIGGVMRPGIVHRLDKDTSGLMIVAKNDHAHKYLSAQLAARTLSRIYHALVLDVPVPIKGNVARPIGRHRHNRLKMSVMSNSPREARTYYKVIKNYNNAVSLVECKLESGRTHQIRVHMETIGHPLIGDALYGPQQTALISRMKKGGYSSDLIREFIEFKHQILFAKEISFIHPKSEKTMNFECDTPKAIHGLLKALDE